MKKIYLFMGLLGALCSPVLSQSKADLKLQEQIAQRIQNDDSEKFSQTDVPEQWKNESAVILYQKYVYFGDREKTHYTWYGWGHRRIKILDKAAVDRFSELTFLNKGYTNKDFFAITIIKADGSEIKVDPKNAIRVDKNDLNEDAIVESAMGYYISLADYSKIAIPSIEVGDIIDYYYFNFEENYSPYHFSSLIPNAWLNDEYPIVSQCIEYNLNRELTYNIKSINGAPEIEKNETGLNLDGVADPDFIQFSIFDTLRDKLSTEKFILYNRQFPQIKVDIASRRGVQNSTTLIDHFISEDGHTIEYVAQPMNIQDFFVKMESPLNSNPQLLQKIRAIINNKCKTCSPTEQAKLVFYQARRVNVEEKDGPGYIIGISRVMSKMGIDHQVYAVISRSYGSIENIISPYELIPAIHVEDPDGTELLMFAPIQNRNVNEYNYLIDGADAYVYFPKGTYKINPANKKRMPEMRKLSQSVPEDNVLNTIMKVTFNDDDLMNVNSEAHLTGFHKQRMIDAILYGYDFTNEEVTNLGSANSSAFLSENYYENMEERRASKIKLRDEYLSDLLEDEYEIDTLMGTNVLNSSVFKDPELRYSQEFTVKNMYSKAGKNILFDLGKLIGSQISLEEKDMERKNDIYYPYPCIYSYDITVTLPDGYYADKFDAFNVSMDNSCMSLQSQVTVEGNQLHFTFRKEYKNSFDTKDKWPEYVEVLEAAYKITQQKLVLKPL